MLGKVRVIKWEEAARRTSPPPRGREVARRTTPPPRGREEHREASRGRTRRRERFPLRRREVTCLKALNDLVGRGFGKMKVRDIMRAGTRVYPESYRMGLNEVAVLESLAILQKYKYAMGFGHAQPRHQTFLITSEGKELLKKYRPPQLDTARPPREDRIIFVDSNGRWSYIAHGQTLRR